MITEIGLCAGEVWQYLDTHKGRATLEALVSGVDTPRETILMAVGWLAREGHILMKGNCLLENTLILEFPNSLSFPANPL